MSNGASPWNVSPWSPSPNTNALDPTSTPSAAGEAARVKAAEVMAALKKGEAGDADAVMGKREQKGTEGIIPLSWLKRKITGGDRKAKKEDSVVR